MMEKPWAVYITWPKFPTPVQSGNYSNRISAEMAKQQLERRLHGYLRIEVVWMDDERNPPSHFQRGDEKRWNRLTVSAVEQRRLNP